MIGVFFPFQRPGERGFERLDGNYAAGRLGCISAPVGGRPRACGRPVRDSVRQPIAAVCSEPRGMTNVSLPSMTALAPGRVKTCASQESVESFSLLPSSDSRRQNFGLQIDQIEKNFLRAN